MTTTFPLPSGASEPDPRQRLLSTWSGSSPNAFVPAMQICKRRPRSRSGHTRWSGCGANFGSRRA